MAGAPAQRSWWDNLPHGDLFPPWSWERCVWEATVRLGVAVNAARFPNAAPVLARGDDELLRALFGELTHPRFEYAAMRREEPVGGANPRAEFEQNFYPRMYVDPVAGGRKITHVSTWAFLRATYSGLFPEDGSSPFLYTDDQLGFAVNYDPADKARTCGINYLTKNLAHNYVHVVMQGINHTNYHDFAGPARYQSDFAADNWATILLACAYGIDVTGDSVEANTINDASDTPVVRMLRRNRCNSAFRDRAVIRSEPTNDDDLEWRLRREIAVYVGGWLVAVGRAASTLAVYFSDPKGRSETSSNGTPLNRNVIFEVNGSYFRMTANLPRQFFDRGGTADEQQRKKRELRTHYKDLARDLDHRYRDLLKGDERRRQAASATLHAGLSLLGAR